MISFIIPTHDRQAVLRQTIQRIGNLERARIECVGGAEIIVLDNASSPPVNVSTSLDNGMPMHIIRLEENLAAAARNIGARRASGEWLIMLDDDSFPLDSGFVDVIEKAPDDVAAIGAEILLPSGRHEQGGLPEVIIGCGAAIRRDAFLAVGGYDLAFHYYAEEYDLCAKMIMHDRRITHDRRFRVHHNKVPGGRSMNTILHRLVRNSGWVIQRYAPDDICRHDLQAMIDRYKRIAARENAIDGFDAGVQELERSLVAQARTPMTSEQYDQFTGLSHVREFLRASLSKPLTNVAIVNEGKNVDLICRAIDELGRSIVDDVNSSDALVIGTLSPGPILDALEDWREDVKTVIAPWMFNTTSSDSSADADLAASGAT